MSRLLRRFIFRHAMRIHRLGLRLGLRMVPDHYYSPVASITELEKTRSVWAKRSPLVGIHVDLDEQAAKLRSICLPFAHEYAGNRVHKDAVKNRFGPGYGPIEAQALHGVLRHFKPPRIIEIGGGVSTACIQHALSLNAGKNDRRAEHTCIDPYPSDRLRSLQNLTLIEQPVQEVDLKVFDSLGDGDFMFVDSSHAVRVGGDSNHIILEILPRLAEGVMVQFHDMFLPYDYPPDVLRRPFQWMETALLRAFLTNNRRVEMIFCMSLLHHDRPEALKECFGDYDPAPLPAGLLPDDAPDLTASSRHFPSSTYLRVRPESRD